MDRLWRDLIGNLFGVRPPVLTEPEERRKDRRAAAGIPVTLEWFDFQETIKTVEGVLENVSTQGFAIRTLAELVEGQTVWVTRPESPALKSIVRHVQPDNGAFVVGLARIPNERRREDRSPVAGAGMLRRTGPSGETVSTEVEIRNVSPEGVQFVSSQAVPKKEVARLVGMAVECMGTVRYCVPWNGKFMAGLYLIGKVHRNAPTDELYGD